MEKFVLPIALTLDVSLLNGEVALQQLILTFIQLTPALSTSALLFILSSPSPCTSNKSKYLSC